jgi:hypothetical protein
MILDPPCIYMRQVHRGLVGSSIRPPETSWDVLALLGSPFRRLAISGERVGTRHVENLAQFSSQSDRKVVIAMQ